MFSYSYFIIKAVFLIFDVLLFILSLYHHLPSFLAFQKMIRWYDKPPVDCLYGNCGFYYWVEFSRYLSKTLTVTNFGLGTLTWVQYRPTVVLVVLSSFGFFQLFVVSSVIVNCTFRYMNWGNTNGLWAVVVFNMICRRNALLSSIDHNLLYFRLNVMYKNGMRISVA